MIICGLDPSLNCLGWFVFDTNGMKIIDYGYIPNKNLNEKEKVLNIYNKLYDVFKQYKIDGVGIEEEFYSRNVDTIKKLSHVHGSIILLLSQLNIQFTYYSVMTAKSKTLGGINTKKEDGTKKDGNEMKEEIAEKIFQVFGKENFMKSYTSDVTDAASIGYTYYLTNGINESKEKKKEEKIKKKSKKAAK